MTGQAHPLQTRACWLTPDRLENTRVLEETLVEFAERSYNTIILPVLYDGEVSFNCDELGDLRPKRCPGLRALEILSDSDFTIWLSIDPLSAGAPGAENLGTLARRKRHWLMKNVEGNFRVRAGDDLPGLFCWTALHFRRYVGNLVTALVEAHPVDGLVFDLRHIPRTTQNPATWTHLGYSCLRWIQDGLDVDLERFLTRPTIEKLEEIDQLRLKKLLVFLENIIARSRLQAGELSTHFLVDLQNSEDPYAPWVPLHESGVVDETLLLAKPEEFPDHVRALATLLPTPLPLLAAIKTETDLGDLAKTFSETSALGFCVLRPGPLGRATMPRTDFTWDFPGAVEQAPLLAIRAMLAALLEEYKADGELHTLLSSAPEDLLSPTDSLPPYQEVWKFRENLLKQVKLLRANSESGEGDGHTDGDATKGAMALRLEALARLLVLSPMPTLVVQ